MSFALDHISISQFNTFSRCELQWFFRYIKGLKVPKGIPLVVGSGAHAGFEKIYRDKKALDKYNLPDALDATRDSVEFSDLEEEVDWGRSKKGEAKDVAVGLIESYSAVRIPDTIPNRTIEAIEVPVNIRMKRKGTEVMIKARPDLVLTKKIIDYKTAGKTPTDLPKNVALQTYLYGVALKKPEVDIHYSIKKKEPTSLVFNCKAINDNFMVAVQNTMIDFWENLQLKIKSGDFLPTGIFHPYGCGNCGYGAKGFCKYWNIGD